MWTYLTAASDLKISFRNQIRKPPLTGRCLHAKSCSILMTSALLSPDISQNHRRHTLTPWIQRSRPRRLLFCIWIPGFFFQFTKQRDDRYQEYQHRPPSCTIFHFIFFIYYFSQIRYTSCFTLFCWTSIIILLSLNFSLVINGINIIFNLFSL